MADLHPADAQLALLGHVASRSVWHANDGRSYLGEGDYQKLDVTFSVNELVDAGWIRLPRPGFATYVLTDAGRLLLAAAAGGQQPEGGQT